MRLKFKPHEIVNQITKNYTGGNGFMRDDDPLIYSRYEMEKGPDKFVFLLGETPLVWSLKSLVIAKHIREPGGRVQIKFKL